MAAALVLHQKGGLYLSVILRPQVACEPNVSLLSFAITVSVSEAILESCRIATRIRWPNDLIINDKKLGGVLCDGSYLGRKAGVRRSWHRHQRQSEGEENFRPN